MQQHALLLVAATALSLANERPATGGERRLPNVARWGMLELAHPNSRSYVNPFTEVTLMAMAANESRGPPAAYPGATWQFRTPEQVGLSRARLDALRDFVGGRGCVVRHGYMVYTWGDPAARTMVLSAAKPWISHFLLNAVKEGRIPSLDQKVSVWEPRLNSLNFSL